MLIEEKKEFYENIKAELTQDGSVSSKIITPDGIVVVRKADAESNCQPTIDNIDLPEINDKKEELNKL